jgi:hypothetical protein
VQQTAGLLATMSSSASFKCFRCDRIDHGPWQ